MKRIQFEQILQEGEGTFIEFKSSFSSSLAKEFHIDKFFTVIFHRPFYSLGSAIKAQEVQAEIRNKLTESDIMIFEICMNEPAASKDIQLKLGKERSGSFKNSLTKLLKMGLLSQIIIDKPSSPKQKYAATELAKAIIKIDNPEAL